MVGLFTTEAGKLFHGTIILWEKKFLLISVFILAMGVKLICWQWLLVYKLLLTLLFSWKRWLWSKLVIPFNNLYTVIRSPLWRLSLNLKRPSSFSLSSYSRSCIHLTSLVARLWIFSMASISCCRWGDQTSWQYSKIGRI